MHKNIYVILVIFMSYEKKKSFDQVRFLQNLSLFHLFHLNIFFRATARRRGKTTGPTAWAGTLGGRPPENFEVLSTFRPIGSLDLKLSQSLDLCRI